jgi:protein required for attachment to host cells
MKIKKELSLFKEKKSLIIVTGKQSAKIYLAENKQINLLEEIEIPTLSSQYSDREGHFKRSGRQKYYIASGSVYEAKKQHLFKKFSNQLSKKVSSLNNKEKPQELYLFTPDYMKNEIKKNFNKLLKEKIVMEFEGNYLDDHVFDLLKKIKAKKL